MSEEMRRSSMENKPTSLSIIPESKHGTNVFSHSLAHIPRPSHVFQGTISGPVLLHHTTLKPNDVYSTGLLPYMIGERAMRVMQASNIFQQTCVWGV